MNYRLLTTLAALAVAMTPLPGAAAPQGQGEGLELVTNIPYAGGTDMELATIRGRDENRGFDIIRVVD